MHKCAFLTLQNRGAFCIYDHLLEEPLSKAGWDVTEIPWNQGGVDWSIYDAVIVRSTWDYQQAPDEFLAVLRSIESTTQLFNSSAICHWNMDKQYLRELESGVRIVPTRWVDSVNADEIRMAKREFGVAKLVAKPRIGANADDTFVLGNEGDWDVAIGALTGRNAMLQPFLSSIAEEGEYSLFYFANRLSHTIVKRPAVGDFRVQEEHGGLISLTKAPADVREVADQAMDLVGETLLYGRADIARLDCGKPAVMELELIEPSLYFDQDDDAPQRFVDAFLDML